MNSLIKTYRPITLEEMSTVKLMNRIDTKFVTTQDKLESLLEMARDEYRMQQIGSERNMEYLTTYFDTADYAMYCSHQHGHANRQKLRFRTYVSSQLQFMEIKTKNNHGRTKKKRISVDNMVFDQEKVDFMQKYLQYDPARLQPVLTNNFRRITLVNKGRTERLTIDSNLLFHNEETGINRDMGPLVIIELKRDGLQHSPVLEMLRQLHIHPHGFSKYCMGSALTNHVLPVNRFKPQLHDVERLISSSQRMFSV